MPLPFNSEQMLLQSQLKHQLTDLIDQSNHILTKWIEGNQFLSVLETSFGENNYTEQSEALQQQFLSGEFLETINIEILSNSTLEGALGAYAARTDTIFLSQDLLASTPEQASSVLLEEVGHAVDDFLNESDTPGDEGAIFASLVQGESLMQQKLGSLRQENDFNTIEVEREPLVVEQAAFTVNTTADEEDGLDQGNVSLRDAIEAASLNNVQDTINFDPNLAGQTINLANGQLNVLEPDGLTIDGDINDDNTPDITVDAQQDSRVFNIDDGNDNDVSVTINGLTIQGGATESLEEGGGISNDEDLTIRNSTISGNTAESGEGGGIYNDDNIKIISSTVSGNTADEGGGGIFSGIDSTSNIINSTVSENTDDGIYTLSDSTVNITNSTISRNTDSGIESFEATDNSTVNITDSTISGNSAFDGGGIDAMDTTLTITNSTISNNTASDEGGGIYSEDNTLTIANSTISGNSSDDNGGGIRQEDGISTITNSTISGNSTGGSGGGIFNEQIFDNTVNLSNSLISGNQASNAGNEIDNGGSINADANNIFGDSSQTNSEAFRNFTPGSSDITASSDGSNPTNLGNILEVDNNGNPLLTDNGGSTETIALAPNSPALDAGDNSKIPTDTQDLDGDGNTNEDIPYDQRSEGFDRIVNETVDLGAVEFNPDNSDLPPEITPIEPVTLVETADNGTEVLTVEASDPDGDDEAVSFEITDGNSDLDEDGTPAFAINDEGVITVQDADDLESGQVFNLTVQADDGDLQSTAEAVVNVETLANLDIDDDGDVTADTDGLLIARALFNFPNSQLVQNAGLDDNSNRTDPNEIKDFVNNLKDNVAIDIDDDGEVTADTDGLLIARALFNFPNSQLVQNAGLDDNSNRTDPNEIKDFVSNLAENSII